MPKVLLLIAAVAFFLFALPGLLLCLPLGVALRVAGVSEDGTFGIVMAIAVPLSIAIWVSLA